MANIPLRLAPFALCALALALPRSSTAQVELNAIGQDRVEIRINGQPFGVFYIGADQASPFLAPLRTVEGVIVTRKYPMEIVEGESRDHPHHRGLWIGYGDVNGINFWENATASKPSAGNPTAKGRVVLASLGELNSGKKSGSMSPVFEWGRPGGSVILEETRKMTFYADRDIRRLDIDTTFLAKLNAQFADTKEGFFAIRVADSMAGKAGGLITNSKGLQTEKNVWGKRADWVDYDGSVEGHKVGIVIFDHPSNQTHPPRWHVRDYGLFAVNPFGAKEFDPNSPQAGGYRLPAGSSLRLRWRVVVHPGDIPKKTIEKWYADYSKVK